MVGWNSITVHESRFPYFDFGALHQIQEIIPSGSGLLNTYHINTFLYLEVMAIFKVKLCTKESTIL
jgi:hypothetical protein